MDDNDRLTSLYNTDVGLIAQFTDANYEKIKAYTTSALQDSHFSIEQPGPWPEFLFRGSVIGVDIDGVYAKWHVDDVSWKGLSLTRVVEP